jgi:phage/plasmid-associated DNA primase
MLNIYDDLSDIPLENVGEFKNLTGATRHRIESKNVQAYDGRIYAVHVFACNKPPSVPQAVLYDPAFWERFEIIKFPYFFEVDPIFKDIAFTSENMSGFLNQVISHIIKIVKGRKLIVNRTAEEVMKRWNELANPLVQFFTEKCEPTRDPSTTNDFDKRTFFAAYLEFCKEHTFHPKKIVPTLEMFTRTIQAQGMLPFETTRKIGDRRHSIKCYRGAWVWKSGQLQMEPKVETL